MDIIVWHIHLLEPTSIHGFHPIMSSACIAAFIAVNSAAVSVIVSLGLNKIGHKLHATALQLSLEVPG